MQAYKTQELINSSKPAEVGKYKNYTFEDVVYNAKYLTSKQINDSEFGLIDGYVKYCVIDDDDEFEDGDIHSNVNKLLASNRAYSCDGKYDGIKRWSPSRIFPTLECFNNQMFNSKYKKIIFCEKPEYYNQSIKDLRQYHNPPSQNVSRFVARLSDEISELIADNSSMLYKCLLWMHVINNIIKAKNKPFIEDPASEESKNKENLYPEKDRYYSFKYLMRFPYNIQYSARDLHKAYDSYFKEWLIKYIQNDYEYIKLIPAIIDNDGAVEGKLMWAIDHFFAKERRKRIRSYPIVIDEQYGEYSSVKTITDLLKLVELSSAPPKGNSWEANRQIRLPTMNGYSETYLDKPGIGTGDVYYVDIEEYGFVFALAVNEILMRDVFKEEYNISAAANAIMDNWVVVNPSVSEETSAVGESTANVAIDATLNEMILKLETAKINPNDMRFILRNNSSENMIFGLSDYNWSIDIQELTEMGLTVDDFQHLTIYEFQPDLNVSFKRIFDGFIESVGNKAQGILGGVLATGITTGVNAFSNNINEVKQFSTNVEWIDQLLDGYYVGQYDIPYFGNRFLSSNTVEGWSIGNALEKSDFLINDLTMNVQDIPTWKYTPGQSEELAVDFYLLNKNIADTIRNMKFLFSFAAGTYWIQSSYVGYRSPNLYRIFCPGRFLMLYASMGINVEYVGKVRRYSSDDAQTMFGSNTGFEPLNVMIKQAKSCNIPEAYKISIKLKDLTPNAFNVQAAYFTNSVENNSSVNIFPKINTVVKAKKVASGNSLKNTISNLVGGSVVDE